MGRKSKLIEKQSRNELSVDEKIALKKMFFMKVFAVRNSKNADEFRLFTKKYWGKEIYFRRYEKLFGYNTKYDDPDFDFLNDGKDKIRKSIIFDLIGFLIGDKKDIYTPDDLLDLEIDNEQYKKAFDEICKKSKYFINESKNRPLFFKAKGSRPKGSEIQYFINTVKSILESHNIILKRGKRFTINKKKVYTYSLSVDRQIKNIIDFKYGKTKKVPGYKTIFKNITDLDDYLII